MTTERPLAVSLTPLENRREVVLHVAERAEELGYDAFFLAEGWGHDAAVLLAEVATRTSRIRIGTGILNTWGRSAAGVAMTASSLAAVSGGRFVLGLGAGSPSLAEGLHGVPFAAPVARLEAYVEEVQRLLRGERATGVTGPNRPLRLAAPPAAPVPVYVAALGPRAVRLAGRTAEGWAPFLMPRSGIATSMGPLREGADSAGEGRPVPLVCPALPLAVSSDPVQARAMATWWVVFYLVHMGPLYRESLVRAGFGDAVRELVEANRESRSAVVPPAAEVLLDELVLWGDPQRARAMLASWYDAGADRPALTLPPGRDVAELDAMLEAMRPDRSETQTQSQSQAESRTEEQSRAGSRP